MVLGLRSAVMGVDRGGIYPGEVVFVVRDVKGAATELNWIKAGKPQEVIELLMCTG